jgi:putative transposase
MLGQSAAMSQYTRPQIPGAAVFFTVAVAARRTDVLTTHIDALREAVRDTRAERPFGVAAWVVLPDHMHCVWQLPQGDSDYSTRMGAIKARFSMRLRRSGFTPTPAQNSYGARGGRVRRVGVNPDLHKGEVGIWQKRFYEHHIRDAADFNAHVRYCWINPVKHGLVAHPKDWPYSSYNRAKDGDAFADP